MTAKARQDLPKPGLPKPGQRWMSDAEPELGLGVVLEADRRSVTMVFEGADESRRYALASAPLRRVRFSPGDVVVDREGTRTLVERVDEEAGLLVYHGADTTVREIEIAPTSAIAGPRERLLAGRLDSPNAYALRQRTHERLCAHRGSPVRGLVGPRVELLPHQFFIAAEVAGRVKPRVLFADETGLGKTIEAGLTVHRLLTSGRAARILVLVPEALVPQWLVELRRRFQLRFAIFDEERCEAIESDEAAGNPFGNEQLVLAASSWMAGNEERSRQAAAAGWDLVVVDEAHHLEWDEDGPSAAYLAVERIAEESRGLLLLTATPEQLGQRGHFARLRLLDRERFDDFETWLAESESFRDLARIGGVLAGEGPLDADDAARIAAWTDASAEAISERAQNDRGGLLAELIDRHGPGRVMFRNTRAALPRVPERIVSLIALSAGKDAAVRSHLARDTAAVLARGQAGPGERAGDAPSDADWDADPRVEWLSQRLGEAETAKLLVFCDTAAKARALAEALGRRRRIDVALFHEELSLVQRDRNAAWFAADDGAPLMICSELGSEGRNFQHASHLVLFDLPLDPDLVEQRIGRLDRIGQLGAVHVEVPYVEETGAEVLVRWHHDAIDTFARPCVVAAPLIEAFGERICELAARRDEGAADVDADLESTLDEVRASREDWNRRVELGRDRLLELSSLRRDVAEDLLEQVRSRDADEDADEYVLQLLEHFRVYAHEIGPRTYELDPETAGDDLLPLLPSGRGGATFDRRTALMREDFEFLSLDHPLVGDAMELMLAAETGNATFVLADERAKPALLLEAVFVLETVAPKRLATDRFLPPTPVRVVTDTGLVDRSDDTLEAAGQAGRPEWLVANRPALQPHLANMFERAEEFANVKAAALTREAIERATALLGDEHDRLELLAARNPHVGDDEAVAVDEERREVTSALSQARLRLDAVRLVWCGPTDDGAPAG